MLFYALVYNDDKIKFAVSTNYVHNTSNEVQMYDSPDHFENLIEFAEKYKDGSSSIAGDKINGIDTVKVFSQPAGLQVKEVKGEYLIQLRAEVAKELLTDEQLEALRYTMGG